MISNNGKSLKIIEISVFLHTACRKHLYTYIYIYIYILCAFLCRTCRRHSTDDVPVYLYYMLYLYLFLCRTCGRHPADDVPVHWDAKERGPPGVGLQGVPAAVRYDIQVQGQGEAHQLHLLPGQENAGDHSL